MTIPSLAEFRSEFPEFANASDPLVQAKLDDATDRTSASAWGTGRKRRQGIMLRTADLLAKSPFGRKLRMVMKDGSTPYTEDLRRMVRVAAAGRGRVT